MKTIKIIIDEEKLLIVFVAIIVVIAISSMNQPKQQIIEISSFERAIIYENPNLYSESTNLTTKLAEICNNSGVNKSDDIRCVHNIYKNRYKYVEGGTSRFTVKDGRFYGDCDTSATFLCQIYEKMGIECKLVTVKNWTHAYALVIYDEGYCNIDQKAIRCLEVT